jgi:hypothetical protein
LLKLDPWGLLSLAGGGFEFEIMVLAGPGISGHICCDEEDKMWFVLVLTGRLGLGASFGFAGSASVGDKKNCPDGYSGVALEGGFGPISGSNTLGSDWHDIVGGSPYLTGTGYYNFKIFVFSFNKILYKKVIDCCKK